MKPVNDVVMTDSIAEKPFDCSFLPCTGTLPVDILINILNSLDSLLLMQSTILLYKSFPEFDFLSSVYHKLLKLN